MYPGRNPGSRSLQGLTVKAEFAKLSAAVEQEQDLHRRCAAQQLRRKTIQNLAFTIILSIASSLAFCFAMDVRSMWTKWATVCLALIATLCNLMIVTRRYPERQAAHFQIAKRYMALAESCRLSVTKYEEKLIGDSEFKALLDQLACDLDALKKETQAA